jgi:hypothetical protein
MYKFKYSLTELDNMLPWEREIYVTMLLQQLQKEQDEIKNKE